MSVEERSGMLGPMHLLPARRAARSVLAAIAASFVSIVMAFVLPAHAAERVSAPPAHDAQVTIDPSTRSLTGRDVIALDPPRPVAIVLADRFTIETIVLDGRPFSPRGASVDGTRRIALPRARRVEVAWRGTLDALDESLSQRDTLENTRPVTAERGTFLPASSRWYPAIDGELERHRVTIDVPEGQYGLVPGKLVAEETAGGRYRATFDFPHPARGIDLVAGPYRVASRTVAGADGSPILVRTYFHAEIESLAARYLDSVAEYLRRFEAGIGPYPFGMYSVVSSPTPTGFGMPAFTYLGIQVLRLPFIRATSLGHEVLHNWWGNGVYPEYSRGNWSEGLTTFMADYAFSEERGESEAYHDRLAWLQEYSALAPRDDIPLTRFTSRTHGASQTVGYGKTAMVFLMLRDEIGREAFERGVRRFWREQRFRVAGWSALAAAFEAEAGRPLAQFFAQWIDRAGAPDVRMTTTPLPDGRASVTLRQSSPPYALGVPIGRGDRAQRVALQTPRVSFSLPQGAPAPELDPDLRLFRRLARGEAPALLRQTSLARDVALFVASPDIDEAAKTVAARLLEHAPRMVRSLGEARAAATLLVVALDADLPRTLADLDVEAPSSVTGSTARAFSAWSGTRLVTVVAATDRGALAALARPLPFYGRYGWVTFDGGRMVARGIGR